MALCRAGLGAVLGLLLPAWCPSAPPGQRLQHQPLPPHPAPAPLLKDWVKVQAGATQPLSQHASASQPEQPQTVRGRVDPGHRWPEGAASCCVWPPDLAKPGLSRWLQNQLSLLAPAHGGKVFASVHEVTWLLGLALVQAPRPAPATPPRLTSLPPTVPGLLQGSSRDLHGTHTRCALASGPAREPQLQTLPRQLCGCPHPSGSSPPPCVLATRPTPALHRLTAGQRSPLAAFSVSSLSDPACPAPCRSCAASSQWALCWADCSTPSSGRAHQACRWCCFSVGGRSGQVDGGRALMRPLCARHCSLGLGEEWTGQSLWLSQVL